MTAPKDTALEALATEAETIGPAPGSAPQKGEQGEEDAPAGQTNAQIISMAIGLGRDVFCTASTLQSPRQHLTPEAVENLGNVWGAVCDKHGWDLGAAIGDWGTELAALAVTAQIGFALRASVVAEIRARNAKPVEAETVEAGEVAGSGI